jgi:hypothetical protein
VKGWKNIYQANGPPKNEGVAILISVKVDFKPTLVKQDKKRTLHTNKMVKKKNQKGNNNYKPICTQCQCTQFIKHIIKDLKAHTDSNTVVVGAFIPL